MPPVFYEMKGRKPYQGFPKTLFICVAPTGLIWILYDTHPSGFACARLQGGLTAQRA